MVCDSVGHRIPFACFPLCDFSSVDVIPRETCHSFVAQVWHTLCGFSGAAAQWAGLSDKRVAAVNA